MDRKLLYNYPSLKFMPRKTYTIWKYSETWGPINFTTSSSHFSVKERHQPYTVPWKFSLAILELG